jgi:hypothetical protein
LSSVCSKIAEKFRLAVSSWEIEGTLASSKC